MTTQIEELTAATNALMAQINTSTATTAVAATTSSASAAAAAASAAAAAASAAQVGGVARVTAVGTVTLTVTSATYQFIDANGANRDVVLPAPTGGQVCMFAIKNTGTANSLTVKTAAAVALDLPVTPGYTLAVVWGGSAWEVL